MENRIYAKAFKHSTDDDDFGIEICIYNLKNRVFVEKSEYITKNKYLNSKNICKEFKFKNLWITLYV